LNGGADGKGEIGCGGVKLFEGVSLSGKVIVGEKWNKNLCKEYMEKLMDEENE